MPGKKQTVTYLWFQFLPITLVFVGVSVLLAGFAEHFTADIYVLLVLQQIDVLLAVLAPEVIAADVLAPMILKTVVAPE